MPTISKPGLYVPVLAVAAVYAGLTVICAGHSYFWDTVQQISTEGHWYYFTHFRSVLVAPGNSYNIQPTGYHPPLLAMLTAAAWCLLGKGLWVSHGMALCSALVLAWNTWKLLPHFITGETTKAWVWAVLLLEPAVLTQFATASPDFVLLTAWAVALRALFDKKPLLLTMAVFFLMGSNMRGLLAGLIFFAVHFYYVYSTHKGFVKTFREVLAPYLPAFLLLAAYYVHYFTSIGWFFTSSQYTGHYVPTSGWWLLAKHLLSLGLRLLEHGKFITWLLAAWALLLVVQKKTPFTKAQKVLLLLATALSLLYFSFVFTTSMPFTCRYFMPLLFVLGLFAFSVHRKPWLLALTLVFELTGHIWAYPEKIAQPWDATLAHLPYYQLRKECFNYIDQNNIPYGQLSGGFCFSGDRGYTELAHYGQTVGSEPDKQFFIYSNISNIDDALAAALKDTSQWQALKTFYNWPVVVVVYKKVSITD